MSERIAGTPTDATGPAIPDGESGDHVRRARIEETARTSRPPPYGTERSTSGTVSSPSDS